MYISSFIAGVLTALAGFALFAPSSITEVKADFGLIQPPPTPVDVLFVGDIMLDRAVAQRANRMGDAALFSGVSGLLSEHDAMIANLEGTITNNVSIASPTLLRFTFDPRFVILLKKIGFSALGLANNHSNDFGEDGYQQTLKYLDEGGIPSFGSSHNNEHLSTKISIRDKTLCLIGFHQLYSPDTTTVISEIERVRAECSYVVVFSHWGEEYSHDVTYAQRTAGHQFIDAGADLVIGAHPHVVEPVEIYNNHAIFYSLGNFMFDQNFSPDVQRGLAVDVSFAASSTIFTLVPVSIVNEELSIADASTRQAVFQEASVTSNTFELAQ